MNYLVGKVYQKLAHLLGKEVVIYSILLYDELHRLPVYLLRTECLSYLFKGYLDPQTKKKDQVRQYLIFFCEAGCFSNFNYQMPLIFKRRLTGHKTKES